MKHGTGQVSMFAKAQAENLIHEIIDFFDLLLICYERPLSCCCLASLYLQSISLKSITPGADDTALQEAGKSEASNVTSLAPTPLGCLLFFL
jgi:hypothetical protein